MSAGLAANPVARTAEPPRLAHACLTEAGPGRSLAFPLSAAAQRVIRHRAGDAAGSVLVLVVGAVSVLLHRLTGAPVTSVELPANLWETQPTETIAVTLEVAACETVRQLLVASQQAVRDAYRASSGQQAVRDAYRASSGEHRAPGDVFVGLAGQHPAGDTLSVRYRAGEAASLLLTSGLLPGWLLEQLAGWLDEVLAGFADLDSPAASLARPVEVSAQQHPGAADRSHRPFAGDRTVIDLVSEQVRRAPEAKALTAADRTLSYADLEYEIDRLAGYLRGVTRLAPGQVVAGLTGRSSWAVIVPLAVMKAGGVHLPVNPGYAPAARSRMLREAGAVLLLTDGDYPTDDGIPAVRLADLPPGREPVGCTARPADIGYVIYTSGTTGDPKGVLVPHVGLTNTVLDHIERLPIRPADRYLQFMANSFDGFLLDIMSTLAAGAELVLADERTIQDPQLLQEQITEHSVTVTTMTPTYLRLLDPTRLDSVRVVVAAGEPLDPRLAELLAPVVELYNGYGPTEATVNSTLYRVRPGERRTPVPIGPPSANKRIYVVDAQGRRQPPGIIGEIWIGGVGIATGYVADAELTAARFGPDPFATDGRIYRTGDFGAWDDAGNLCFVGRRDSQVKVNGFRVELGEIDSVVAGLPGVLASHTFATDRASGGTEIVVAFHGTASPDAVRAGVSHRLPGHMVPGRIVRIEDWPWTLHRKSDLPAVEAAALASNPPAPREGAGELSEVERALISIWSAVLDRPVSVDESFFRLGGDSIRAIQVTQRAAGLGIPVEVGALLEQRTIRQLAATLPTLGGQPAEGGTDRQAEPDGDDHHPASAMQSYMIAAGTGTRPADGIYLGFAEWHFEDEEFHEPAMLAAIQALYEANPALRTTFAKGASGDTAVVHPARPLPVPRTELTGCPRELVEAHIRDWMAARSAVGFDPYGAEPLFTVELVRSSATSCSLLVGFHHALLDGWSGVELRNQLYAAYQRFKAGDPEYRDGHRRDGQHDFVLAERALAADQAARQFWRGELARAPIGQWPELPGQTGYTELDVELAADLIAAAQRAQQAHDVSLKAVFLRAFASALFSAVGRPAMQVGIVVNGRSDRMASPLRSTGLFWNIAPLGLSTADLRSPAAVQARLTEQARFGSFPLKVIEDELAGRPLAMPIFNFVRFHNTGEGASRFREGILQSRFHFPLTCFVRFPVGPAESGKLRLGYDRARMEDDTVSETCRLMLACIRGEDV